MPSSQSSNSNSIDSANNKWLDLLSWVIREVTGIVFVFSGFVKAIDPWGTLYKFAEYFSVWGISIHNNLMIAGVFLLCAVEFMIGVFLMFGCYRKSVTVCGLLFMFLMLSLTLWLAVANPISDCGCFGDALILSNWQTFWKNVILTGCLIYLVKFNPGINCIITPAFQWMAFTATGIFIMVISWFGFNIQPMLDFRPFKVGTLMSIEASGDNESSFVFTYEKDGVSKDFSEEDELPAEDSGWIFIRRKEIFPDNYSQNENQSQEHEFRIWDREGEEDVTEDALTQYDKNLLMLIPSLKDVSASTTWKINALYDWTHAHGIGMMAIIALHSGDIAEWEDLSMPRYEIYTSEDTSIKELARGNPAVVYVDNGVIKWKTSLASLNDKDFATPETSSDINSIAPDSQNTLKNISFIYLAVMGVLVAISFIPRFAQMFYPLQAKKFKFNNHKY